MGSDGDRGGAFPEIGCGAHEQLFLSRTAQVRKIRMHAQQHMSRTCSTGDHSIRKSRFLHMLQIHIVTVPLLAWHALSQRPQQPPEHVPRLDICIFLQYTAWSAVAV